MGSGEKIESHPGFGHGHNRQQREKEEEMKDIPKGCLAILVGNQGEEKLERFVVPVIYINHPLFMELLKEAEEEYGFQQKGPITIPCHVEDFRNVQGLIDREHQHHHHHHHHHHPHDHHPHHHHFLCFKA
ncbi:Auxin-responsive protein saur32 [Dionaea muscipula]